MRENVIGVSSFPGITGTQGTKKRRANGSGGRGKMGLVAWGGVECFLYVKAPPWRQV